jgi:hypothetical protein
MGKCQRPWATAASGEPTHNVPLGLPRSPGCRFFLHRPDLDSVDEGSPGVFVSLNKKDELFVQEWHILCLFMAQAGWEGGQLKSVTTDRYMVSGLAAAPEFREAGTLN